MVTEQPATHSFYFKYFAKIAICARHPKQKNLLYEKPISFLDNEEESFHIFSKPHCDS